MVVSTIALRKKLGFVGGTARAFDALIESQARQHGLSVVEYKTRLEQEILAERLQRQTEAKRGQNRRAYVNRKLRFEAARKIGQATVQAILKKNDVRTHFYDSALDGQEHVRKIEARKADMKVSALSDTVRRETFVVRSAEDTADGTPVEHVQKVLSDHAAVVTAMLRDKSTAGRYFKVALGCSLVLEKKEHGRTATTLVAVRSPFVAAHSSSQHDNSWFKTVVDSLVQQISSRIATIESGFVLQRVVSIFVDKFEYKRPGVRRPRSGGAYVSLPQAVSNRQACINVKNLDERCLMYCIAYTLFSNVLPAVHLQRPERWGNVLDRVAVPDKAEFPVPLEQLPLWEEANGVRLCVWGHNPNFPGGFEQLWVSEHTSGTWVDTLLVEEDGRGHYVIIKDLPRLLGLPAKSHVCRRCGGGFKTFGELDGHLASCERGAHLGGARVKPAGQLALSFPKPGRDQLEFSRHDSQTRAAFVGYADLETRLDPQTGACIPIAYRLLVVNGVTGNSFDSRGHIATTDDPAEVVRHFWRAVRHVVHRVRKFIKNTNLPMRPLTDAEQAVMRERKRCHICHQFFQPGDQVAADHEHFTGEFLGPAHMRCNLNRNRKCFVLPIFFHNASGFDGHFLLQELPPGKAKIRSIPLNGQRFLCFSTAGAQILDSNQFFHCPLAALGDALAPEHRRFSGVDTSKGLFPHGWLDSVEKLGNTSLPPLEAWTNGLTGRAFTEEDVAAANQLFVAKRCKTVGRYLKWYLAQDVALLADAFEALRNRMLGHFGIDPAMFPTLPSYMWQAWLRARVFERPAPRPIQLFTDEQMYNLVIRAKRGGIAIVGKRFAEDGAILALDVNSMYASVMASNNLPCDGWRWAVEVDTPAKLEAMAQAWQPGAASGFFAEVDLDVPSAWRQDPVHLGLPLAPEHVVVQKAWLSDYQQAQLPDGRLDAASRLVCSLLPKRRYVCHAGALQLYLSTGMVLKKVHKVLTFCQAPVLRETVTKTLGLRAAATNPLDKLLWKLAANSLFGKTVENPERHTNTTLCTSKEQLLRHSWKPGFDFTIINENLVAVHTQKTRCTITRPVAIGVAILELAKVALYRAWHSVCKLFPTAELLLTDTDSLIFHVPDGDRAACAAALRAEPWVGSEPGQLKLQDDITGFCGLSPKMYALKLAGGEDVCRAKGLPYAVAADLGYERYKQALFSGDSSAVTFSAIVSRDHQVGIKQLTRVGLSAVDVKFYRPDAVTFRPFW